MVAIHLMLKLKNEYQGKSHEIITYVRIWTVWCG
jgi:hypothetical protein